jgi:SAM-dependent methyltransferase
VTSSGDTGGNAEQVRYWNETAGPKWVAYQALLDAQLRPLGVRAMERGGIAAGDRVVDVGCGCGDSTLELARRVAPGGEVVGLDPSALMLARARERAREAGVGNATFVEGDAQTHALAPASFDAVYSRFGVMFFADPVAAFANLRRGLRPGGRLAFVCWQAMTQNPWLLVPLMAAAQHLTLPPPPAPGAPGPFAFADRERVGDILRQAGFADIDFADVQQTLTLGGGGGVDAAVRLLLEGVGPTSAVLREAEPAVRERVTTAVRAALAPFADADGVRMPSAAWVVSARA